MKVAIYIADGRSQIVLTPETEFEKRALSGFRSREVAAIQRGSFYECQGGWTRHGSGDDSVMLIAEGHAVSASGGQT